MVFNETNVYVLSSFFANMQKGFWFLCSYRACNGLENHINNSLFNSVKNRLKHQIKMQIVCRKKLEEKGKLDKDFSFIIAASALIVQK